MDRPDPLRGRFRTQQALNERNRVNLQRQESGYQEKDHSDSRHI